MRRPTTEFGTIWTVSGLFLSALVGAGFATGRELFIYFVQSGVWGGLGFAVACVLLGFGAYWMTRCREKLQAFKWVVTCFTFCAYITMVAGFRDVLTILFPAVAERNPVLFGLCACGIITAFSLFIFYRGFAFFATLCKIITPLAICTLLVVCCVSLSRNVMVWPSDLPDIPIWQTALRTILYIGYNVLFLAGVVGRSGTLRPGRKETGVGHALGASLFWLSGTGVFTVLLYQSGRIQQSAMPLCTLVQDWGVPAGGLFAVIVAFAMLLSAASSLCAASCGCKKEHFTGNILALLAVPASYMGFNAFLSTVYPVFGIVGILLLITLAQTYRKNV